VPPSLAASFFAVVSRDLALSTAIALGILYLLWGAVWPFFDYIELLGRTLTAPRRGLELVVYWIGLIALTAMIIGLVKGIALAESVGSIVFIGAVFARVYAIRRRPHRTVKEWIDENW
jgi:hypothetical protein